MKTHTLLLLLGVWAARTHASALRTDSLRHSVASVHLEATRSAEGHQRLSVEAFNQRHTLHLRPSSSPFAESFTLQTITKNEQGLRVLEDIPNVDDHDEMQLFEDQEAGGVVQVSERGVEGLVSPSLAVQVGDDGQYMAVRHEQEMFASRDDNDYVKVPEEASSHLKSSIVNRGAVKANVEMYVIVDSTLAAQLGSNKNVKKYLGVFWNAVNMRFASFKDPEIRIVLVKALIIRDSSDETFINNNVLLQNYIHGSNTLESLGKWLYKKNNLPSHDMVYLMTGWDMASVKDGQLQQSLAGIAYFEAACREMPYYEMSIKVAVGEASSSYGGVFTAAHEVAHNLGSPHDGEEGAESCPWSDGYIMSYVTGTLKEFLFSSCSQQLMKNYISGSDGACLLEDTTSSQIEIPDTLPGQIISMEKQCQTLMEDDNATPAIDVSEDSLCLSLKCELRKDFGTYYQIFWKWAGPALEGSPCKSGGACRDGTCKQ